MNSGVSYYWSNPNHYTFTEDTLEKNFKIGLRKKIEINDSFFVVI